MSGGPRLHCGQVPFGRVGRQGGKRRPCGHGGWNHGPIEECPERMRLLPGLTQGSRPSHGTWASYDKRGVSASGGRLGWRSCLRKGCGRTFQARRYNQRYCQDPECLREVRRWQGAKRQRKCRSQPEGRQRHAEAERQRRKQRASAVSAATANRVRCRRTATAENGAWSRSRRHPEIFCDRPGCYEPLRDSPRAPASYCGDDCRAAMRQARDRERKWLRRKTEAGRFKRRLEYQAAGPNAVEIVSLPAA